jgi:hypothetical protein
VHNCVAPFTSHCKLHEFGEKPISWAKPAHYNFFAINFTVWSHILSTGGDALSKESSVGDVIIVVVGMTWMTITLLFVSSFDCCIPLFQYFCLQFAMNNALFQLFLPTICNENDQLNSFTSCLSMHMMILVIDSWEDFASSPSLRVYQFCFWFSVFHCRKQVVMMASYSRATEGGDCAKSNDWSHQLWKDRDCHLPCQYCICIFCEGMFLLFGFLVVLTGKEGILPIFLVKFFKLSMCKSFGVILLV